ncbi:hypothetical protein BH23GEM6_BH23GEM6_20110 [soil metagenome]
MREYKTPILTKVGGLNDVVQADRVSLNPDGVMIPGDMVLLLLTKS